MQIKTLGRLTAATFLGLIVSTQIAHAASTYYSFLGAFSLFDSNNESVARINKGGTLEYDFYNEVGSFTFNTSSFQFLGNTWSMDPVTLEGNGTNEIFGSTTSTWGSIGPFQSEFIFDASGFLGGANVIPPSDTAYPGSEIGPAPMVTTTKEWDSNLGLFASGDDGIVGVADSGPVADTSVVIDFLSFTFLGCDSGGCALNPVLPTAADPVGGLFNFNGASGLWYDPPAESGYTYTMTDGSLFTEILDFPMGFNEEFEIEAEGVSLGLFGPGESVDFEALLGHGVSVFTLLGITPGTDPSDPTAFPLQLEFNTETASFNMQAISSVPVPAAVWLFGSGLLGLIGVARRKKA